MRTPILFRNKATADPLQALCPWMGFLEPEIVLNKDGGLLAGFRYAGLDPDNIFHAQVDQAVERMQAAYAGLDGRITVWWIIDKRACSAYPFEDFSHAAAADLDRLYGQSFSDGSHFSIDYFCFILFTGASGTARFLDRVQRVQAETGKNLVGAGWQALLESFSMQALAALDMEGVRDNADTFKQILVKFKSNLPVRFTPLRQGEEFEQVLSGLLNRASERTTATLPDGMMLDGWAPRNWLDSGPDFLQFTSNTATVLMAVLGITKFCAKTAPLLFETLLAMEMPVTVVQTMRFLSADASEAVMDACIGFYKLTKVPLLAQVAATFSDKAAQATPGKVQLLAEAEAEKTLMSLAGVNGCWHNVMVLVYGRTQKELSANVETADSTLSARKFVAVREKMNAGPSFGAFLPGQWALQSRWFFNGIDAAADCTPILTMDEGEPVHSFFTEMVFGTPVNKIITVTNRYGGPVYFSPHVGQTGHMLLIMPTEGGKSTFVNFCTSQMSRYPKIRRYIFDRNRSCDVVAALHDAVRARVTAGEACWNPFSSMTNGSEGGQAWVRQWLLQRLADDGYLATPADREVIDEVLALMAHDHHENRTALRMSTFLALLPNSLEQRFQEWREGGAYGIFDSEIDAFAASDWITFQMHEIMPSPRLAYAFIDYAFRKIYEGLDGTPTFIYVEEATFMLNNPKFLPVIDEWLKTFRKLFAFVWLTMQSPQSITQGAFSAILLDNIFTFLFGPNVKFEAHRAAYCEHFGLLPHHVDLIGTLPSVGTFLMVQNGQKSGSQARILRLKLDPQMLAYLRSEIGVLNCLDRHLASAHPNWKDRFLAEVACLA